MKICLDIDNTILNYEPIFFKASRDIPDSIEDLPSLKKYLQDKSQEKWLETQGKCYGELVKEVDTFPYVKSFIQKKLDEGDEVYLVSHKSKDSYCGNYSNLQEKTKKRLEELGITSIVGENNIFLEENLKDKLKRIEQLAPSIVIDDLEKVITNETLKKVPLKLLFAGSAEVQGIFSPNWKQLEGIINLLREKKLKFEKSLRTANNSVSLVTDGDKKYVLKIFQKEERYIREKEHLKLLEITPKLVSYDDSNFLILMDFIEGQAPLDYSKAVKKSYENLWSKKSPLMATHRRLELNEYLEHILNRFKNKKPHHEKFKVLHENLIGRVNLTDYSNQYDVLCSPDMCLDNLISNDQGEVYFIDLESSGMDDPLRSLGNAIFHSRSQLTEEQVLELFSFFGEVFPKIFCKSFELVLDLVAFDWLLLERDPEKSVERSKIYQKRLESGNISFSLSEEVFTHAKRLS